MDEADLSNLPTTVIHARTKVCHVGAFVHFFGQCVTAVNPPSSGSVNNTDLVLSQSLLLHQKDKLPSGSDKISYKTGASKPSSLGIRNVIQVET